MRLYYYQDSERKGPIASVQLRNLARKGEITPATVVESEYGSKTTAGKIAELFPNLSLEKEFAIAFPQPQDAEETPKTSTPPNAKPTPAQAQAQAQPVAPQRRYKPRPSAIGDRNAKTKQPAAKEVPASTTKSSAQPASSASSASTRDSSAIKLDGGLDLDVHVDSVSYEPPKYEPPKIDASERRPHTRGAKSKSAKTAESVYALKTEPKQVEETPKPQRPAKERFANQVERRLRELDEQNAFAAKTKADVAQAQAKASDTTSRPSPNATARPATSNVQNTPNVQNPPNAPIPPANFDAPKKKGGCGCLIVAIIATYIGFTALFDGAIEPALVAFTVAAVAFFVRLSK